MHPESLTSACQYLHVDINMPKFVRPIEPIGLRTCLFLLENLQELDRLAGQVPAPSTEAQRWAPKATRTH